MSALPAPPREANVLALPAPYLLFLGDTTDAGYAKTAFGLRDWARDLCVGEFAMPEATVTTGLPRLTPREAHEKGARSIVIGVANTGGVLKASWIPSLVAALEAGLDVVSGMHSRLTASPELKSTADRLGRRLIDVRQPPAGIPVGTGRKRSGKRLLTVGTDCALGKKYTALALAGAFRRRGVDADFRATGQTGIMIAGSGMPMDAVISDFIAGAAELLSPDAAPDHWDVIEGQGSLFHPAYAGVTLGLLHGSQPDALVLCHDVSRTGIADYEGYAIPSYESCFEAYLAAARLTNPAAQFAGVSLNTSQLEAGAADRAVAEAAARVSLPCCDPIRHGVGPIVDRILAST